MLALLLSTFALAGPDDRLFDAEVSPSIVQELMAHEAEILQKVGEHDPAKLSELQQLKESNKRAYVRELFRIARKVRSLRDNPERMKRQMAIRDAKQQLKKLAKDYWELDKSEQKNRKATMTDIAQRLFELKQEERKERLAVLQHRIGQLEAEIEERADRRDALIDDFLDQLVTEPVDL